MSGAAGSPWQSDLVRFIGADLDEESNTKVEETLRISRNHAAVKMFGTDFCWRPLMICECRV